MAAISITQRDSIDTAEGSTGPVSGTLTSLIETAASRLALGSGDGTSVAADSLALLSELLVSGPGSFNVHAHETGRIAEFRDLLDLLCAETLRSEAAGRLSAADFVEAVEAFARSLF